MPLKSTSKTAKHKQLGQKSSKYDALALFRTNYTKRKQMMDSTLPQSLTTNFTGALPKEPEAKKINLRSKVQSDSPVPCTSSADLTTSTSASGVDNNATFATQPLRPIQSSILPNSTVPQPQNQLTVPTANSLSIPIKAALNAETTVDASAGNITSQSTIPMFFVPMVSNSGYQSIMPHSQPVIIPPAHPEQNLHKTTEKSHSSFGPGTSHLSPKPKSPRPRSEDMQITPEKDAKPFTNAPLSGLFHVQLPEQQAGEKYEGERSKKRARASLARDLRDFWVKYGDDWLKNINDEFHEHQLERRQANAIEENRQKRRVDRIVAKRKAEEERLRLEREKKRNDAKLKKKADLAKKKKAAQKAPKKPQGIVRI